MEINQNQNTMNGASVNVEDILKRANSLLDAEEHEEALWELSKAESILLVERNAEALALRGSIKYTLNQSESAIEDFNRAEKLNPLDVPTILFRARAYLELNMIREAYVDIILLGERMLDDTEWSDREEEKDKIENEILKGHSMAEFNLVQLIGEGAFGKVHLATWNGKCVALKTPRQVSRDALIKEALTSMKFQHENIVSALGLCNVDGEEVSFIMEYAQDGSLYDLLRTQKVKLTREQILIFARDVASGLAYLHRRSTIHRDLKSANILLFEQKTRAKIADFGQSRFLNENSIAKTVIGTFGFIAPEVLAEQDYDEKADIYSFGVLLLEMCTNATLPILIEEARMNTICKQEEDYEFRAIIMDCCKTDPRQRPTSQECLDRISVMFEDHQKRKQSAAAREQCRTKFKEFLPLWQALDVSLKRSIVTMFLSLKCERPDLSSVGVVHGSELLGQTFDTDELIPADFAFKKEFIDIAKDIVANYPTDREKERQMEFAPRYIRDSSITPAQTVVENNTSGLTPINVLLIGEDDDCKEIASQFCRSDFEKVHGSYSIVAKLFKGSGLQMIDMTMNEPKKVRTKRVIRSGFDLFMALTGPKSKLTYFDYVCDFLISCLVNEIRGPIHVVLVCFKNMDWKPRLWNITHHYMSKFAQVIAVHVVDSEGEDKDEQIRCAFPRELFSVSRYHRLRVQDRTTDGVTLRASDMHDLARSIAEEASNWTQTYGQLFKENREEYYKRLRLPEELLEEPVEYEKRFVLENSKQSKCIVS